MQDLVLYIVKNLVSNPDAVLVEEHNDGGQVDLLLTVDPVDMGLVIGKGGQTIKAIRKVLIVKAMADNVRVNLQLAEPEGGRPEKSETSENSEESEVVEQSNESEKSEETPVETTNETKENKPESTDKSSSQEEPKAE